MSQSELEKWVKKNKRKNNIRFWLWFLPVLIVGWFLIDVIIDAMKEGIESLSQEGLLLLCIGVGVLMIWLSIDQGFQQRNRCTTKINAECIGIEYKGMGYYPRFLYQWEGETYVGDVLRYATKRKTKQRYIVGNEYEILINPDNPREIRVDYKIGLSNMFLLIMGVVMVVLPVYIMLLEK